MTELSQNAPVAGGTDRQSVIAQAGRYWMQGGALLIIVAVLAIFAIFSPLFLTLGNIGNVLQQTAVIGILAIGLTWVLMAGGVHSLTGGIDLSIAANMGLCAAVYAILLRQGCLFGTAMLGALLTGMALGLLNAVAVVWLRIMPLLATLTTMNIAIGLEMVVTQNAPVPAAGALLDLLISAGPLAVPWLAWGFALVALLFIALAHFTCFGLRLQAVGGYPLAARAAGLAASRYVALSYVLCGLCAGIAALASVAVLSGSSPGSNDNLLMVIAAALLGVVFSRRLVPTIGGTLISGLFLSLIANGFQLINISSYWINGVEGALILLVVSLTAQLRRRQQRRTISV